MNPADVSVIALLILFLGTIVRGFHLGLAAFVAAFFVALYAGIDMPTLIGFFPGDFFILVVGATCLFAVALVNGTVEWLLGQSERLLTRGTAMLPWLIFAFSALLPAIGMLPGAAIALLAPITLAFAARYKMSIFLAALVTEFGIIAGMYSPIGVFGITANNLYSTADIVAPEWLPAALFGASLGTGLLMSITFVVLERILSIRRARKGVLVGVSAVGRGADAVDHRPEMRPKLTAGIACTIAGFLILVVVAIAFSLNVGFLAMALALVLHLTFRIEASALIAKMPWSVVFLITGILTYIGLMQHLGAFERISSFLTFEGAPLLSLLAICYIAGFTSFFASSLAVFATAVPLLPPLIEAGLNPVGALIAVAMSSVLVDINPLGPTGGFLMAAAPEEKRQRLFRQLMVYGIVSIFVVPPVAVLLYSWI